MCPSKTSIVVGVTIVYTFCFGSVTLARTIKDEIEEKRIKKAKKKGTFEKRVYLEKVIENGD